MILSFFLSVFVQLAFGRDTNCSQLWSRGFPDQRVGHSPFACTQFQPKQSYLGGYNRIYFKSSRPMTPELDGFLEAVAESFKRSTLHFRFMGDMPPVTVILFDQPSANDGPNRTTYAEAVTGLRRGQETCPVLVYPAAESFGVNDVKQIIAHELFHCFQMQRYPRAMELAGSVGRGLWWVEGTAQIMGNFVYPSNNFEYSSVFGEYRPSVSLTQQPGPYNTVHFFQSYLNQKDGNPNSIVEFMDMMALDSSLSI